MVTWESIAIAKYGTSEGLPPMKKAAVTREMRRQNGTPAKVRMKLVAIDELTFSCLAKAVYGTDDGLSSGQKAAINREVSRRSKITPPENEKESYPSRYIKKLPAQLVTFDDLAEAMYGSKNLSRAQTLIVQQEVNRRRFQSTLSDAERFRP
jgi:hypothetical protein